MIKRPPPEKTPAIRQFHRAGATDEQIAAHELAVLREVLFHADIGGNAAGYVVDRIEQLEGGAS
ncbi:hypothetical protein AB0P17_43030 [Streptomyces sp. NPDC088124]|uniref:hypothetical protein n=1 Tax=Streptomyces sp. NPDC088124 TaxID=3154654 RepID=UPI00343F839A